MAALSSHSDIRKSDRRVSCETLCSSNSSCVLQKRKPLHPLATSVKTRTSNNPVTQRVLSAKLLRFKTLQNQLNDAHFHITQLVNENRILKNLQKRQDQALLKYEGANAQLPKVLESHQEEMRVLQTKNKSLRKNLKEIADQLKTKDEEINSLKDQNRHLLSLCKTKNLEERKDLQNKVEDLEARLRQNESTISLLNRKLMLESKNYKYKLNSEINNHKKTQKDLNKALDDLSAYSGSEVKLTESAKKPASKTKSQSVVQLTSSEIKISESDIKKELEKMATMSLDKLIEDTLSFNNATPKDERSLSNSSSEAQLKEIVSSLHKKPSKFEESVNQEMKKYSEEVMSDFRYTTSKIDEHTAHYNNTVENTEILLQSLKENDVKQERLAKLSATGDQMSFLDYSVLTNKSSNDVCMDELINNEKKKNYSFEDDLLSDSTTKLTISEPEVDSEDRKCLLAKLKAIDDGDIESDTIDVTDFTDLKKAKCDLMKELFGS